MFSRLKKFKVHGLLGEGLNAKVYKVSKYQPHLKTEHFFALKVLKRSEDLRLFKLEFENLLKAQGKRLVSYRGWEKFKSKPALLLDLIEGVTLFELIKTCPLNQKELQWIYQEVHEGLKELEQSGLCHGDLSTKNIMLNKKGQIKLIDFGLSHWSTRKIEVTPEFAAPLILDGGQPSLATDLFSLKKIILQIETSHSFSNEFVKNAPASLTTKINQALSLDLNATKSIPKTAPSKKLTSIFKKQSLIWASALVFAPIAAPNSLQKTMNISIRSSDWISVSTSKNEKGCFTPCSLKLNTNSIEKIYWKKNNKSGNIRVYTNNKTSTVFINTKEL